ncbi:protein E27 [Elephant endotheliotropic herpesvirus 2]|nr:protein E27 [Elephant endotheliotropic herpesvirus 2]
MKDWSRSQQLVAALLFPLFIFWLCVTTATELVVLWIDLLDHRRLPMLRGYKLRAMLDMDCTPKTIPALLLGILLLPPCAAVLLVTAALNIVFFFCDLVLGPRGVHAFDRYRMWILRSIFIPVANGEKNLLCNMCKVIKKYDIVMMVDDEPTETHDPGSLDLRTVQQIPASPTPVTQSPSSSSDQIARTTGSNGGSSNSTYPSSSPISSQTHAPNNTTPVDYLDGGGSLRSRFLNLVETEV